MNWVIIAVIILAIVFFVRKRKPNETVSRLELKTIPGEKPTEEYDRKLKTKVVGVTFDNVNGSSRQVAISRLSSGDRLQLAWNPSDPYDSNAILVFGKGTMAQLEGDTCIGHLKADLAADVVDWINSDDIAGIYAEVSEILGGTEELPSYGCLIELTIY
jgi:HIRAN domain-containing protein